MNCNLFLEKGEIKMTNKDNMKKVIMNDFDKNNNYNNIIEKIGDKNVNKYKIIASCAVFLILICGIVVSNSDFRKLDDTPKKEFIEDNIIFNDDGYVSTDDSIAARPVYIPIKSKFSFLSNLAIPDGFVISNEMEVYVSADENDHNMSKLWEYYLEYCVFNSDKTECLNSFGISFTKEKQILGMGLWKRDESKYKKSTINGHDVTLYGSEDFFGMGAFFEYDEYNFYVASTHLTKKEFVNLLKSIIKD